MELQKEVNAHEDNYLGMDESGCMEVRNHGDESKSSVYQKLVLKKLPKDIKSQMFSYINSREAGKILAIKFWESNITSNQINHSNCFFIWNLQW